MFLGQGNVWYETQRRQGDEDEGVSLLPLADIPPLIMLNQCQPSTENCRSWLQSTEVQACCECTHFDLNLFFCFLIGRMFSLWGSHSSENAWHSDDLLAEVCWYHIAIFESWWASEKVGTLRDTKVETGSTLSMWAGKSWRWRVWQSEWPNPQYVISTSISKGKVWYGLIMFVPHGSLWICSESEVDLFPADLLRLQPCNLHDHELQMVIWVIGLFSEISPQQWPFLGF